MHILLTNDDSHDSPLFLIAIEIMKTLGDVSIVVPAEEQSWKGKAMTRHHPIYAQKIDLHGHEAWSVTGTPADCTNLGIYNLLDTPPDVVVSGINIGVNVGLGFLMASGTVGAALEGNIARLPGLALSQHLSAEEFGYWDQERQFAPEVVERLSSACEKLIPEVWKQFLADCPAGVTWSVNLPNQTTDATQIVHSFLGRSYYGRCFEQHGDQYRHRLAPFDGDADHRSDGWVVRDGHVAITEIDLSRLSVMPGAAKPS